MDSQLLQNIETCHVGKSHIEEYQVGRVLFEVVERVGSKFKLSKIVFGSSDLEAHTN